MNFAAQHVARAILVAISFVRHSKPLPIAEIGVEKGGNPRRKGGKNGMPLFGNVEVTRLPETWNSDIIVFCVFTQKLRPSSAFLESSNDQVFARLVQY